MEEENATAVIGDVMDRHNHVKTVVWADRKYLQTEKQSLQQCEKQLSELQREQSALSAKLARLSEEHERVKNHIRRVQGDIEFHTREIRRVEESTVVHHQMAA